MVCLGFFFGFVCLRVTYTRPVFFTMTNMLTVITTLDLAFEATNLQGDALQVIITLRKLLCQVVLSRLLLGRYY